jgi:hypothetical protein
MKAERIRLLASLLIWLQLGWWSAGAQIAASSNAASAGAHALPRPAAVDLRPVFEKWGLTRRSQGKRSTCSVFTMAGALEFAAASRQRHGERFSVEFLHWAANRVVGEDKDGGFFSDLWRAFAEYGICPEQVMPYRAGFDPAQAPTPDALAQAKTRLGLGFRHHWIKEWDVNTGLSDDQILAIKRTLDQGLPVCAGLRWPRKPQWCDDVLQMRPAEAVYDGHSVLLIGYRNDPRQAGDGIFLFRNSGEGGGDASMPYSYARAYMNDAVWIDCPPASKLGL